MPFDRCGAADPSYKFRDLGHSSIQRSYCISAHSYRPYFLTTELTFSVTVAVH